jgi:hypothetical protein
LEDIAERDVGVASGVLSAVADMAMSTILFYILILSGWTFKRSNALSAEEILCEGLKNDV